MEMEITQLQFCWGKNTQKKFYKRKITLKFSGAEFNDGKSEYFSMKSNLKIMMICYKRVILQAQCAFRNTQNTWETYDHLNCIFNWSDSDLNLNLSHHCQEYCIIPQPFPGQPFQIQLSNKSTLAWPQTIFHPQELLFECHNTWGKVSVKRQAELHRSLERLFSWGSHLSLFLEKEAPPKDKRKSTWNVKD